MQATESCRNLPTRGNRLRTLTIVGLAAMAVAYGGLWLVKAYPDTTVGCYVGESSDVPPMLRDGDSRARAEALLACDRHPPHGPAWKGAHVRRAAA